MEAKLKSWFLKWKQSNVSAFLSDFKASQGYWLLTLIGIVVLFQTPIKTLLKYTLIDTIISSCPQNASGDLVFIAFLLFAVSFFFRQLQKHLLPTLNSIIFACVVLMLYVVFFKSDNTYNFYHFYNDYLNGYTYTTPFLISSLLLVVSYKSYLLPLSKKPSVYSLLDDYPSATQYKDTYSRSGYATSISTHIMGTSSEVSFAIGIVGDWGSGKSDFMLRVKKELENNAENILFDFNPWRVNKADAIIEEFFKTLSKKLKPYNQSITRTINDYSNRILKTAKETHYRFLDVLITNWLEEDEIQKKYETINDTIKATGKRVVIFIDDVDRLTGKEVMEVLRIIRNTANFANTFFIVGVDQNYIINVLHNTKDFANEEEYLKKVFQLTITLPAFKKDIFLTEIKRILFTDDLEPEYKEVVHSALTRFSIDIDESGPDWFFPAFKHEFLLEKMIDSLRDLKRFCNSFKIVFNILKKEADIHDLIVLELIRNKSIEVYNSIRSRELIVPSVDSSGKFEIEKSKWEKIKIIIPEKDQSAIKEAIDYLLSEAEYKNQRMFIYTHNFFIYFSYQLFNLISFDEFNQVLRMDADVMFSKFNEWIAEGKEKELVQIISNIRDFKDGEELKKFVTVLLRLWTPHSAWLERAKRLVVLPWKWNHKKYFQSDNALHKDFLCGIMRDKKIDPYVRANLVRPFLDGIIENPTFKSEFFITRKEIRNAVFYLFEEYLLGNPHDAQKTEEFYHLNDFIIKDDVVVYFPPVSKLFKKYLLSNDTGFAGYTRRLLRPSQDPYNGELVLEPWIQQVFPDLAIFEDRLLSIRFSDQDMAKLRSIISQYFRSFFDSGRKPIKIINQNDLKFLERYLGFRKLSSETDSYL